MSLQVNERGELEDGEVHGWFGLSYASYLVLPRIAMEAMPLAWQRQFVVLLDELASAGLPDDTYSVQVRDRVTGRFVPDPWAQYRRGDITELRQSIGAKS